MTGTRVPLAPDDPRHGTPNGYSNLGCRCEPCKGAWARAQDKRYSTLNVGEGTVSIPRDFDKEMLDYAERKGLSKRKLAMTAITHWMKENP